MCKKTSDFSVPTRQRFDEKTNVLFLILFVGRGLKKLKKKLVAIFDY